MRPAGSGKPDHTDLVFVDRFDRATRIRTFMLRRLLRAHRHDFPRNGRIAAIVGDEIGDQIRILGRYEDIELKVIEALILPHLPSGSDCVDIGANIGNHSLFFSEHFARVIAFEPNPAARSLLDLNLRMNGVRNVEVRPTGLSDGEGSARLSVCIDNLGATRLDILAKEEPGFSDRVVEEVEIELATGDSLLDLDRPISFIKIDVEGLERKVLLGLAQTVKRHRPVIMLEQLASAIDAETGRSSVSDIMATHGYHPYEARRVVRVRFKILNELLTLLFGTLRYVLVPVHQFEQRQYSAVLYLPDEVARLIELTANIGAAGDQRASSWWGMRPPDSSR